MWLENSLWGRTALDEVGEVGRGQSNKTFGLCWVPLNQAISNNLNASSLFESTVREPGSEPGREGRQDRIRWGAVYHCGHLGLSPARDLWKTAHGTPQSFSIWGPRELGFLSSSVGPSLVETCSQGINSQGLPANPAGNQKTWESWKWL